MTVSPLTTSFSNDSNDTYINSEATYLSAINTYINSEAAYLSTIKTYINSEGTYIKSEATYLSAINTYISAEAAYTGSVAPYCNSVRCYSNSKAINTGSKRRNRLSTGICDCAKGLNMTTKELYKYSEA